MLLVVALALGLLALLAVPLEVGFELERVEALRGHVSFRWLLGLVRVRVAVPRERPSPAEREDRKARRRAGGRRAERRRARERRAGGGRRGKVVAVLRQATFRRRVGRLLADLVRAVRVRRLRLLVRLGLGDPADTGRLWALLGPLGVAARGLPGAEVRIVPEFVDAVLELEAGGHVRLVPLQVLALALRFALSPASLRAFWTLGSGRA